MNIATRFKTVPAPAPTAGIGSRPTESDSCSSGWLAAEHGRPVSKSLQTICCFCGRSACGQLAHPTWDRLAGPRGNLALFSLSYTACSMASSVCFWGQGDQPRGSLQWQEGPEGWVCRAHLSGKHPVPVVGPITALGEPQCKHTQQAKPCQDMINSGTQRKQQNVYFSESRGEKLEITKHFLTRMFQRLSTCKKLKSFRLLRSVW